MRVEPGRLSPRMLGEISNPSRALKSLSFQSTMSESSRIRRVGVWKFFSKKVIAFFEWLFSFLLSPPKERPEIELRKMIGEEGKILYEFFRKGDKEEGGTFELSIPTATLTNLTLPESMSMDRAKQEIVKSMRFEKTERLRVSRLDHAQLLWKLGLKAEGFVDWDPTNNSGWDKYVLELLKEAEKKQDELSTEQNRARVSMEKTLLTDALGEKGFHSVDLMRFRNVEALLGCSFDLQHLKESVDESREKWLFEKLQELIEHPPRPSSRSYRGKLSIKLHDLFHLSEGLKQPIPRAAVAKLLNNVYFQL